MPTTRLRPLAIAPWAALLAAAACSGNSTNTTTVQGSGSTTGSSGATGSTAATGTDAMSGVGAAGSVGSGASATGSVGSGASAAGSVSSGAAAAGASTGTAAAGASSGTAAAGASSGAAATGASSGTGAAGASSGAAGASSGSSTPDGGKPFPSGMSVGCGMAPVGANSTGFTAHDIDIPACGATFTQECVAPAFVPGGASAQSSGAYTFIHRNYQIKLPNNYQTMTAYPVVLSGAGCGSGSNGFGVNETGAIDVHLSILNGCFADGGTSCSGTTPLEPSCVNTPEIPYIRAVLAQVEANFCVDVGHVYIGGYSSGAWEAFTASCAMADVLRGMVTLEGGMRNHRPACTGPIAALMVAGGADGTNPIGPLVQDMPYPAGGLSASQVNSTIAGLDSNGSAPGRDDILARNGCIGTATTMYDPKYPDCVKYTGCPAAYPVVWCPIPMCGHICSTDNGVNYSPGSVQGDPLMWNFLTSLRP